jgi:hypothetical protein
MLPSREAYPIPQFCEIYSVGKTFTYAEIKANRLKACKAGSKTLILREEAERWARALPCLRTAPGHSRGGAASDLVAA